MMIDYEEIEINAARLFSVPYKFWSDEDWTLLLSYQHAITGRSSSLAYTKECQQCSSKTLQYQINEFLKNGKSRIATTLKG